MIQNSQTFVTQIATVKSPYFRDIEYFDLADSEIGHRWKERLNDLKFFQEILRSRSNIFLHGSNGSGKTTFVQDSIRGLFQRPGFQYISIFVDCIEFYSEKLISISISQQLNLHIASILSKLKIEKKHSKKITFKLCQNFAGLLASLQFFHNNLEMLKAEGLGTDKLGPFNDFFFYLVLDNVKTLFKIEKDKKVIEKLAITQSKIHPTTFSIVVINDALVQEIQVFREQPNVFDEYMFTNYFFRPPPVTMLCRLILEVLQQRFIRHDQSQEPSLQILQQLSHKYLDEVFEDFFNFVQVQLSNQTASINEYIYFFTFLYPEYMQPIIIDYEAQRLKNKGVAGFDIIEAVRPKIQKRGQVCVTGPFKGLVKEMLNNLYVHSSSKEDIKIEVQAQQNKDSLKRILIEQKNNLTNKMIGGQQNKQETQPDSFQLREITYLNDFQKTINFTFMQSVALIAGYIAGMNKESMDCKLFDKDRAKMKNTKQKEIQTNKSQAILLGKSKKFSIDRYFAILDFILFMTAGETQEARNYGHSLDYLATINSLAEEGLLRKTIIKKSDSTLDDLSAIAFKCNFDQNFISDVAMKINFAIKDYLLLDQREE